ncbi:MAG: rRNA maturation RNase YbeY [Ekhidna sp.]
MPLQYFKEETEFSLDNADVVSDWLSKLISNNNHSLSDLNYIFCSDDYLLSINKEHLDHDYYTDIITFDSSESESQIEGDIFISVDRVKENASTLNQPFTRELHRVMAHGLLHLFGFADKTDDEKKLMREKEDLCLSLLKI